MIKKRIRDLKKSQKEKSLQEQIWDLTKSQIELILLWVLKVAITALIVLTFRKHELVLFATAVATAMLGNLIYESFCKKDHEIDRLQKRRLRGLY